MLRVVIGDRRSNFAIWSGGIYRRKNGWRREVYRGTNGHYHHMHISILHGDTFEDDRSGWGLASATAVSNPIAWTGPVIPAAQHHTLTPITPEDDMTPAQDAALAQVMGEVSRIKQILEAFDPQRAALVTGATAAVDANAHVHRTIGVRSPVADQTDIGMVLAAKAAAGGSVDYAELARAVNDDAARRLAS